MKPGEGVRCDRKGSRTGRSVTLPPLPVPEGATHAVIVTPGRGGGRPGGLKDLETGQVASRAVSIPGPMAGPGSPVSMADPGTREALAEQETWPLFFQVGQGAPWPWL